MVDRTKYDIMENEEKIASAAMIDLLVDIHEQMKKFENSDISSFECNNEITKLISNAFSNFKVMAHIGYENAKDIYSLDMSIIKSSFNKDRNSLNSFSSNYEKVINKYAKTLLIFCILDDEDIDIKSVSDMLAFNSIIMGNTKGLLVFLASNGKSLSEENCELAARLVDERFVVTDLNSSQIKKLNDYHDRFVRKYINPKITSDKDESGRILKQAKRISAAGRFNK